jgi:hypothetical protein
MKLMCFFQGRREGERHCIAAERWAFDNTTTTLMSQHIFKVGIFVSCKISRNLFYIMTLGLPEMILYAITFRSIIVHTNQIASNGVLKAGT